MSREQDPALENEPLWRRISKAFGAAFRRKDETRSCDGVQYRYSIQPGGKNAPPSLTVAIECKSHGDFELRKENAFDRFFKRMGVACEIQTGDPAFDADYYIHTDTPDFTRVCFGDSRRLTRVREIYEAGFTSIKHDGETLAARIEPLQTEPGETLVEQTVSRLVMMAKDMPASPQFGAFCASAWKRKRSFLIAVSLAIYATGMICLVLGLISYPPLDGGLLFLDSLRYSLPALALYLFFALVTLKGRSASHKEWAVAAAVSLAALPVLRLIGAAQPQRDGAGEVHEEHERRDGVPCSGRLVACARSGGEPRRFSTGIPND